MAKIGKEDENMVEQKDVMILAIESSCDETAASVVKKWKRSPFECNLFTN